MCTQEGQISCHDVPTALRLLVCRHTDHKMKMNELQEINLDYRNEMKSFLFFGTK